MGAAFLACMAFVVMPVPGVVDAPAQGAVGTNHQEPYSWGVVATSGSNTYGQYSAPVIGETALSTAAPAGGGTLIGSDLSMAPSDEHCERTIVEEEMPTAAFLVRAASSLAPRPEGFGGWPANGSAQLRGVFSSASRRVGTNRPLATISWLKYDLVCSHGSQRRSSVWIESGSWSPRISGRVVWGCARR